MPNSNPVSVSEGLLAKPASRAPFPPYVVLACSLVFFWSISVRALVYTVMPTIASNLRLTSSAAGAVVATMLLGYCAGGWASGWLPGSRKARILVGVAISLPATAAFSQVSAFFPSLVASLALGLGIGLYLPLGMALLVDAGRGGRSAAYMSVHELAATLGSFSGSAAVALLLAWTDWHGAILGWSALGVLAVVAFMFVQDPEGDRHRRRAAREPVPFDLRLLCGIFVYGTGTMLVMGLVSMLALIMVRAWGIDQVQAASVLGYSRLAGLIGVAVVGFLAERWGHSRVLLMLQGVALTGLVIMSLDGFGPLFVGGVLLLAVGASGYITLIPVVVAESFPVAQRERVMAYSTGPGGIFGIVAAPALFGVMLDAGLASGPIVVAAAMTGVSMVLAGRIFRTA